MNPDDADPLAGTARPDAGPAPGTATEVPHAPGPAAIAARLAGELGPGDRAGPYEIVKRLGRGGFGTVYEAVRPDIDRRLAIKVLHAEHSADADAVRRFRDEARVVNQIEHRWIVGVFDFGQLADGRWFYAMDLLRGKSLAGWQNERGGRLPPNEVLPILAGIADALATAHRAGVVHRDVKPDNIFVADDGTARLLDFGIAKLREGSTSGTASVGTPLYMAPEQYEGRGIGPGTDVYALGGTLYHVLVGRPVFMATSAPQLMHKHLSESPPPPSSIDPALAPADAAILAMLDKRAETRPGATAAITAVAAALGVPLASAPDTPRNLVSAATAAPARPQPDHVTGGDHRIANAAASPAPSRVWLGRRWWLVATALVVAGGAVALLAIRSGATSTGKPSSSPPPQGAPFADRWRDVGGGRYPMGSARGEADEAPVHEVVVPELAVWRTEVTVAEYRACVEASACPRPPIASRPNCNYGKPDRDDHPVNCVDWQQARDFAVWVGGRLPSEAEWEFVARARGQERLYPWGDQPPSCDRAIFGDAGPGCGRGGTAPVGTSAAGVTPEGIVDLAGNVWEWVADAYHPSYAGAPGDARPWDGDPSRRVARGGSWDAAAAHLRASNRGSFAPTRSYDFIGFRVVR